MSAGLAGRLNRAHFDVHGIQNWWENSCYPEQPEWIPEHGRFVIYFPCGFQLRIDVSSITNKEG